MLNLLAPAIGPADYSNPYPQPRSSPPKPEHIQSSYNQWPPSAARAYPSRLSCPILTPTPQRPRLRNTLPPITSTTTRDTPSRHTRRTRRALQPPSLQIHKALASFLHSACLLLLRSETTAGKALGTVRSVPTSPTTPTFALRPQPILPNTPSSSLIPLIPILLSPIHAAITRSSPPSITPINCPWLACIHPNAASLRMLRHMVLPHMPEAM